jgi:hypothetical protein
MMLGLGIKLGLDYSTCGDSIRKRFVVVEISTTVCECERVLVITLLGISIKAGYFRA